MNMKLNIHKLEPNHPGPDPTALYQPRPHQDKETTIFAVYTSTGDGIIGKKVDKL